MTGGNARHGRRNNGLYAADYAVVGDVDPRVGEHLLDVLGNRGIAAYLQPTATNIPITRLTTLPGRPVDRLFVDRRELGTAREFLDIATADTAGAIDPDGLNAPLGPGRALGERVRGGVGLDRRELRRAAGRRPPSVAGERGRQPGRARRAPDVRPDTSDPRRNMAGADRPDDPSSSDPTAATAGPPDRPARRRRRGARRRPAADRRARERPSTPARQCSTAWTPSARTARRRGRRGEDYHPPPPPPLPRFAGITVIGDARHHRRLRGDHLPGAVAGVHRVRRDPGRDCLVAGGIALIARLRSGDEDDDDDPDNGAVV